MIGFLLRKYLRQSGKEGEMWVLATCVLGHSYKKGVLCTWGHVWALRERG